MGNRRFSARKRKQLEANKKIMDIMMKSQTDLMRWTPEEAENQVKIMIRDMVNCSVKNSPIKINDEEFMKKTTLITSAGSINLLQAFKQLN